MTTNKRGVLGEVDAFLLALRDGLKPTPDISFDSVWNLEDRGYVSDARVSLPECEFSGNLTPKGRAWMAFVDSFAEFRELLRERELLRAHNQQFEDGRLQQGLLLMAEAAISSITLERFLRIVLGPNAKEKDTLPNLLEKATSERLALLTLPAPDRIVAIQQITNVRNTLLHGNYEQAARDAGVPNVTEYFRSVFASEAEAVYQLLNRLLEQFDPQTVAGVVTGPRRPVIE